MAKQDPYSVEKHVFPKGDERHGQWGQDHNYSVGGGVSFHKTRGEAQKAADERKQEKPYRSSPSREKYDVYHSESGKKVQSGVLAHQAGKKLNIETDEVKGRVEEEGRVDSDTHTAVPAGSRKPGKFAWRDD